MADPKNMPFSELILALALMIAVGIIAVGLGSLLTEDYVPKSFPLQLISAFQNLMVLIAGVAFLLKRNLPSHSELGIRKAKLPTTVLSGTVAGLIIGLIQFPFKIIIGEQELPREYFIDFEASSAPWVVVTLFTFVIAIPILQEIFYRFYLYWGVRNRFGRFWAYLVSALLFSLGHTGIASPQILLFILSSIILVYLYERTDSLGSCMIAHVVWNATWFGAVYGFA